MSSGEEVQQNETPPLQAEEAEKISQLAEEKDTPTPPPEAEVPLSLGLPDLAADVKDRALGCVLGALVGDSLGSYLEFTKAPSKESVDMAFTMPGGGHWGVSPGQVTDDGEMTLSLLRALNAFPGEYKADKVAARYMKWATSPPFDMGKATYAALGWSKKVPASGAAAMVKKRAAVNHRSQANGQMMRSSPLGVFCHKMDCLLDIMCVVKQDVAMTHPNETTLYAGFVYVAACARLIRGAEVAKVMDELRGFVEIHAKAKAGAADVLQWLTEAREAAESNSAAALPPFQPQMGWVRIAFTHGFYHLLKQSSWEDAMRAILSGGGDTDTNACIVSGLLGAAYGLSAVPQEMVNKMASCDTTEKLTRQRPKWLIPTATIFAEVEQLAKSAPMEMPKHIH